MKCVIFAVFVNETFPVIIIIIMDTDLQTFQSHCLKRMNHIIWAH